MTFWKRPRTLVLTALILVAAWMVWKQSREQAIAGTQHVSAWLQEAVREAADQRDVPPRMGETHDLVREALAEWVRAAVPEHVAPNVRVDTASLRDDTWALHPEATHRALVTLQGKQLAVFVVWDGTTARAVGVERLQPAN